MWWGETASPPKLSTDQIVGLYNIFSRLRTFLIYLNSFRKSYKVVFGTPLEARIKTLTNGRRRRNSCDIFTILYIGNVAHISVNPQLG